MKKMIALICLLLAFQSLPAQQQPELRRKRGETLRQFAARVIARGDRLVHAAEGDFGSSRGNIVVFFDRTDSQGTFLQGWVLVPAGSGKYRKYEIEDDDFVRFSTVETIFFTNADRDAERELVVLTSAPSELLVDGKRVDVCAASVFDWTGDGFVYLRTVSENLSLSSDQCTAAAARRLIRGG